MTTTYDPHHREYRDEADVRAELTRGFDVCRGCRRCVDLCGAFPTLFELVDRFDDRDPGRMTPAEQDRVVAQCHQCKLCHVDCPYTPERHESALDFPRLMLRAEAMRRANGHQSLRRQVTSHVVARTDRVGRVGSAAAPMVNRLVRAPGGSPIRRLVAALTGVSSVRPLPAFSRQRLSTWMRRRTPRVGAPLRGSATVFPTCVVEYHDVQVGRDLVAVYERNGIECSLTGAGCCGAPWLLAGDVDRFTRVVNRNVRTLAREVRSGGGPVVVPEPSCRYVLAEDYPAYCDPELRADAELVAGRVVDASAYLVQLHRADATGLDTDFAGAVPERIVHHPASQAVAPAPESSASRDLLLLTGAEVTSVHPGAGIDGSWGLRVENEEIAIAIATRLAEAIERAGGRRPDTVVSGDCGLTNLAIGEQTGVPCAHPLSVLARAYAIPTAVGSPLTWDDAAN